jgi:hypothetical protein
MHLFVSACRFVDQYTQHSSSGVFTLFAAIFVVCPFLFPVHFLSYHVLEMEKFTYLFDWNITNVTQYWNCTKLNKIVCDSMFCNQRLSQAVAKDQKWYCKGDDPPWHIISSVVSPNLAWSWVGLWQYFLKHWYSLHYTFWKSCSWKGCGMCSCFWWFVK